MGLVFIRAAIDEFDTSEVGAGMSVPLPHTTGFKGYQRLHCSVWSLNDVITEYKSSQPPCCLSASYIRNRVIHPNLVTLATLCTPVESPLCRGFSCVDQLSKAW